MPPEYTIPDQEGSTLQVASRGGRKKAEEPKSAADGSWFLRRRCCMRILFACTTAYGHLHPLVPLARAATDAGHEVAFATGAALARAVAHAGFRHFPAGLDWAPATPL